MAKAKRQKTKADDRQKVFDYRALRLMMGIIALSLPVVVSLRAGVQLTSISASYYTKSHDLFVGLLFFVAAFLFAYNGNSTTEARVSNLACLAAVLVATFPTDPDDCQVCNTPVSMVHYGSAALLFGILAYFCLFAFRQRVTGLEGKKKRREVIYITCGWTILACMAAAFLANFALPGSSLKSLRLTYWAEFGALWAFGIAWLVAGKSIPWLAEEDEIYRLDLFKRAS